MSNISTTSLLVLLSAPVICALGCGFLAAMKGLSVVLWGVLGLFTGPLALIGILIVPERRE